MIAAQEEERKRVARNCTTTGQSLTPLAIGLRALESVQSVEEAQASIAEMRAHAGQAPTNCINWR